MSPLSQPAASASLSVYIAKTDPELTLQEHTQDVIDEADDILKVFGYEGKYRRLTGKSLRDLVLRAALLHDWGKAHDHWQKHAKAGTLRTAQFRHEMASVAFARNENEHLWPEEEVAILAHHSKLGHYHTHRWHKDTLDFSYLWDEMRRLEKRIAPTRGRSLEDAIRARYAFSCVRGLLRLADQRASQRESRRPDPLPLEEFDYTFPWEDKRSVQKAAERLGNEYFAALRAETGSGKTAASLLWAQAHIAAGRARRMVIALPTRFTATSLSQDVRESVQAGLYHSSAWFELEDDERAADRLSHARQFLSPLTVTTIDQVLMALTGQSEDHHLRFANLAHSALVIDEIDAYSDAIRANLQVLMRALRMIDVPVLMMSATLPTSQIEMYAPSNPHEHTSSQDVETTATSATENHDQDLETAADSGADPNRTGAPTSPSVPFQDATEEGSTFVVKSIDELSSPSDFPVERVADADRAIVYANTVARAVSYYRAIKEVREDVVLYHSRFTQPDRARKENEILQMLGEDGAGGVVVMTQVGEMSLNISAPVMVSEVAPIDRIAQRTGRMCRFSDAKGSLYLLIPLFKGQLYPAPYGTYDREAHEWTPAEALVDTIDLLETGNTYGKIRLRNLAETVYEDLDALSPRAQDNAERYVDREIIQNWLIVPKFNTDLDETATAEWQTRFIPPQVTVFTEEPDDVYEDAHAYRRAELLTAVSIYERQAQGLRAKKVQIGEDEPRTVTYTKTYDPLEGLV